MSEDNTHRIQGAEASVYRHHIYGGIASFDDYEDIFLRFPHYTANDKVLLYINSEGGCVDVGRSIINAMQECEAEVICIVEGGIYSMGSVIALSGDSLIMNPCSFIMIHNYSGGLYGKGQEMAHHSESLTSYFNRLLAYTCCPFLSKKELNEVLKDQDVYVHDNDPTLTARLKRHFKKGA